MTQENDKKLFLVRTNIESIHNRNFDYVELTPTLEERIEIKVFEDFDCMEETLTKLQKNIVGATIDRTLKHVRDLVSEGDTSPTDVQKLREAVR